MKVTDIALEHRTNRLTRLVGAMALVDVAEPASRRAFTDQAKAIRLCAEGTALERVATLSDRLRDAVLGQPDLAEWHKAIEKACNEVASAARREW